MKILYIFLHRSKVHFMKFKAKINGVRSPGVTTRKSLSHG